MTLDFLRDVGARAPGAQEIHVILDNSPTHKTRVERASLVEHPKVHLHFTPTDAPWLNQIELWFPKIERDLLECGILTSVNDVARHIYTHVHHDNKRQDRFAGAIRIPCIAIVLSAPGHYQSVDGLEMEF